MIFGLASCIGGGSIPPSPIPDLYPALTQLPLVINYTSDYETGETDSNGNPVIDLSQYAAEDVVVFTTTNPYESLNIYEIDGHVREASIGSDSGIYKTKIANGDCGLITQSNQLCPHQSYVLGTWKINAYDETGSEIRKTKFSWSYKTISYCRTPGNCNQGG